MNISEWVKCQKDLLGLVTRKYSELYLVGGTAMSLLYNHRISEDLDFFSQNYSQKLYREVVRLIRKERGYRFTLIGEETREKYVNMAVYEFEISQELILKIDFVSDYVPLIKPRQANGIASMDDIYYRKILAVVGWKAGESLAGKTLAGGRQKTKDLFDVYYLSQHFEKLHDWFPVYFDRSAYERLTSWYLSIPKQKVMMELLDLVDGCDTRAVFAHLDEEIIHELNRRYVKI